ncbi:MAG: hypothetical protein IPK94_06200 [Saprospiraceae bacterium]|nr:hypothetical protein [Saprospiraceae bacterium]
MSSVASVSRMQGTSPNWISFGNKNVASDDRYSNGAMGQGPNKKLFRISTLDASAKPLEIAGISSSSLLLVELSEPC